MGHKNYTKYSKYLNNNDNNAVNPELEEVVLEAGGEIVEEESVTEEVTVDPKNDEIVCFVTGCKRLNVREKPSKDSKVLCIIDEDEELTADMTQADNSDFYAIRTSKGIEGYCMKKFITFK